MEMDEAIRASLQLLYMRAWVSLNAKDAHNWTDHQVQDAFHILPPPMVSFSDWLVRRGFEQEQESTPDVEEGPGWLIANGEEGKRKIEQKIRHLAEAAKNTA